MGETFGERFSQPVVSGQPVEDVQIAFRIGGHKFVQPHMAENCPADLPVIADGVDGRLAVQSHYRQAGGQGMSGEGSRRGAVIQQDIEGTRLQKGQGPVVAQYQLQLRGRKSGGSKGAFHEAYGIVVVSKIMAEGQLHGWVSQQDLPVNIQGFLCDGPVVRQRQTVQVRVGDD